MKTGNTGQDNLGLWIIVLEDVLCSRCGETHDELNVKELDTKFVINEPTTITHYKMSKIGLKEDGSDMLEPIPLENFEEGAVEFKTPIVIEEVGDGVFHQYGGWSWCKVNDEPMFFHMVITLQEDENDKSEEN